jgi:hypothetical protein
MPRLRITEKLLKPYSERMPDYKSRRGNSAIGNQEDLSHFR